MQIEIRSPRSMMYVLPRFDGYRVRYKRGLIRETELDPPHVIKLKPKRGECMNLIPLAVLVILIVIIIGLLSAGEEERGYTEPWWSGFPGFDN